MKIGYEYVTDTNHFFHFTFLYTFFKESIIDFGFDRATCYYIVKVIVEPYDFITPYGEVMRFQHSWAYGPKDSQDLVGHTNIQELSMV